ncbi:hypothetical protein PTTG_26196 [Puccinia triticina 1-1 BBBD Race 1]|uniref:Uncharacterized protein n=1 Tax=Puccinia triticina (isolate 1-1 / race 1 (BBBD)) TaxID=630390 RepID=A0A180GVW7_PUCT1|nr:hypothetical protein PTTG_26196 [Puccinia triticina 1-1 BBBD Race 1]
MYPTRPTRFHFPLTSASPVVHWQQRYSPLDPTLVPSFLLLAETPYRPLFRYAVYTLTTIAAVDQFYPINLQKKTKRQRKRRTTSPSKPLSAASPSNLQTASQLASTVRGAPAAGEVENDPIQPPKKKRRCMPPEIVAQFADEPLDRLRKRVEDNAEYERLAAEDKAELDEAYQNYQRAILVIAAKNKLHAKPVMDYLGLEGRLRGPTNFNNFCRYDEVASPIYRNGSVPYKHRMVQCGELWGQLDKNSKRKWKDDDFIDAAIQALGAAGEDELLETDGPDRRQFLPRNKFSVSAWSTQVKRDLRQLSHSHQVEGFLVLASRDPDHPFLTTGGSLMSEEFLDITAQDSRQWNSFFRFVNGQQAIKEISGCYPSFPSRNNKRKRTDTTSKETPAGKIGEKQKCIGTKAINIPAVREKLKDALAKATHGLHLKGWPGTKTAEALQQLGVTLSVKTNDYFVTVQDFCARPSDMSVEQSHRILTGFSKGWVKLTGPPPPETEIGGVTTVGYTPSDDEQGATIKSSTSRLSSIQGKVHRPIRKTCKQPASRAKSCKSLRAGSSESDEYSASESSVQSDKESSVSVHPQRSHRRRKSVLPNDSEDENPNHCQSEEQDEHTQHKSHVTFRIDSESEDNDDD